MPLAHKHRTTIYQRLSPIIGEEEADALLSQFPSYDDELVTRSMLDSSVTDLRTEIVQLRGDLRTEIAELRTELRTEIAELRTELRTEIADVRTEIAELRSELHDRLRQQTAWMVGAIFSSVTLSVALSSLVAR